MLAEWDDSYSVGIERFDNQHKQLFFFINTLFGGIKAGKAKEALEEVLESLAEYTRTHFSAEEALMAKHNFPGLQEHAKEHEEMLETILAFGSKPDDERANDAEAALAILIDWLHNHLGESDRKYADFFAAKGVKK